MGREVISKPSYGMVGISRIHGGNMSLYGSELRHETAIRLTIKRGRVERNLSQEWYYGGDDLIEVDMSEMQFSEFMTTMNIGSGVPCTIRYTTQEGMIEHAVEAPKRLEFDKEVAENCKAVAAQLEKLRELVADTRIPAGVRKALASELYHVDMKIRSTLPFIQSQFRESMDRTTTEAKAAVEGFVVGVIHRAGLEAIAQPRIEAPALEVIEATDGS